MRDLLQLHAPDATQAIPMREEPDFARCDGALAATVPERRREWVYWRNSLSLVAPRPSRAGLE